LIKFENEKQNTIVPWKRSKSLNLDALALNSLKQQNFDPASIPDNGKFVALRRIENTEWGGVDEEVTQTLHPENLRIALMASMLFNLDVAGVDMISSDISQPWYVNGAIINEVNYAPLLGGGHISRSHLDRYVSQLIPNQGRIPIVAFVGGVDAMKSAQNFLQSKHAKGQKMVLTSADSTIDENGHELHMPLKGLNARTNALLIQKTTQALIVVVQTNEILLTPFCLDKIDDLYEIDNHIVDVNDETKLISEKQIYDVFEILRNLKK
jgi:cyanophycin synthetase